MKKKYGRNDAAEAGRAARRKGLTAVFEIFIVGEDSYLWLNGNIYLHIMYAGSVHDSSLLSNATTIRRHQCLLLFTMRDLAKLCCATYSASPFYLLGLPACSPNDAHPTCNPRRCRSSYGYLQGYRVFGSLYPRANKCHCLFQSQARQ
jgi:hypothetical protein